MMDGWFAWKIFTGLLAVSALLLSAVGVVAIWRVRGILHWKGSLRDEFKGLQKAAGESQGVRRRALEVVIEDCNRIWKATSLDPGEVLHLSTYIRSIAGCYHPEAEKPELRVSTGSFLNAARASADRLEMILRRPGFERLQKVRIRHIRQSFVWYQRVCQYRIVRYLYRYRNIMRRVYRLRLIILPDPFSLLAYFSNRLTMLILTRCLLMDVYLFVGKMAVDTYDEDEGGEDTALHPVDEIEKALEALDAVKPSEPYQRDPRIRDIRNRLVGINNFLFSTSGFRDWKTAVQESAEVIAAHYFPAAERPLEEAAIGPLLYCCQDWIRTLSETEKIPIVKQLHRVRLESLYNIKSITELAFPSKALIIAKRTRDLYRWMKWPLMIYRWIKKTSPLKITIDVGWILARKGFVNFALRYTFDTACRELDAVYRQSRTTP
ncbi:MAG: hypothetical protein Q7J01_00185 [Syntrophales bacterium]|nr:hypothetical protein [Syntrophales bacterium]